MTSTLLALWSGLLLGFGGPVTEVSIRSAPSATTEILIAVDGEVEFREFTMEGPSRLVVDLFGARHNLPGDNYAGVNRGGVTSVRTSQYSDDVVRVVLEVESLAAYEVISEPGQIRVVMQNPTGEFEPWTSGASGPADLAVAGDDDGGPHASRTAGGPSHLRRIQRDADSGSALHLLRLLRPLDRSG